MCRNGLQNLILVFCVCNGPLFYPINFRMGAGEVGTVPSSPSPMVTLLIDKQNAPSSQFPFKRKFRLTCSLPFLLSYGSSKDVRDQSCRQVFHVRTTAPSPVRDVVYCPNEGHTLAAAFENGLACIWDTRNDSRPARCFQAHNAVTASIDWHPMWNSSE